MLAVLFSSGKDCQSLMTYWILKNLSKSSSLKAGGMYESRITGWERKLVNRLEAFDRQLFINC